MTQKANQPGRKVLVTTAYRGVFFGEIESREGDFIVLRNARCAIRFGTTKGFLELADTGPTANSKIGAVAPRIELFSVTSISDCTEPAVKAWEAA